MRRTAKLRIISSRIVWSRIDWSRIAIASAMLVAASAARAGDPAAGEAVYRKCRACHQLGEAARNSVGPELNGILGRPAAGVEGYSYSAVMRGSGLTWDEASLRAFIRSPREVVPGTKMAFAGVKDETDLDNVVAFLRQFRPDGTKAEQEAAGAPAE
jgi:cytochrome c